MKIANKIAFGILFVGFLASLPVWAIASKPIKLENIKVDAVRKIFQSNELSKTGSITLFALY